MRESDTQWKLAQVRQLFHGQVQIGIPQPPVPVKGQVPRFQSWPGCSSPKDQIRGPRRRLWRGTVHRWAAVRLGRSRSWVCWEWVLQGVGMHCLLRVQDSLWGVLLLLSDSFHGDDELDKWAEADERDCWCRLCSCHRRGWESVGIWEQQQRAAGCWLREWIQRRPATQDQASK